jgi:hypothetical protein
MYLQQNGGSDENLILMARIILTILFMISVMHKNKIKLLKLVFPGHVKLFGSGLKV